MPRVKATPLQGADRIGLVPRPREGSAPRLRPLRPLREAFLEVPARSSRSFERELSL
jgi:hypothetical protein